MKNFFAGQAAFEFGGPELLFTAIATSIILALLGPRWLQQRRAKSSGTPQA